MPLTIEENTSLKAYNTFRLDARARYFAHITSVADLQELLDNKDLAAQPRLVLGGGSNVLLTQDWDGLVMRIGLPGIEVVAEDDAHWWVKAGAGENWHQLVLHCIQNGYAGIENLSLIPGNVGAAPMQNIGAYGVELKDVFHELEALEISTGQVHTFGLAACEFGYRTSIFKTHAKGKFILLSVTLKLNKQPSFNTSYGAIEKELEALGIQDLSIAAVSQAVINIRQRKLPDPNQIGNAGSFFKNPVIPTTQFEALKTDWPAIVGYPNGDKTKVAAGWLIEAAGWKGKDRGTHGVHKNQALVLVNYGEAKGADIYQLSEDVLQSVNQQFGIALEREVNVI